MFVNLKLDKFNEILFFSKIIKHVIVKAKQLPLKYCFSIAPHTCMWMDLTVKEPSPLYCSIALAEAVSWVNACASDASSWLAPNDSSLSLSLLKELATILSSQRAINFSLDIYTNLQEQFLFKKVLFFFFCSTSHMGSYPNFLIL